MAETPAIRRWQRRNEDPSMDTNAFSCICAALPAATETVRWGDNHVFKTGGKMFAVADSAPDQKAPAQTQPGVISRP
jgi:predicted DNA-binding protein (MmcQ/YjbR family)